MEQLFYQPSDGFAADFIPYCRDGVFHLFYLKDWRNTAEYGEGTPWYHIVTRDFTHYQDRGEAIPRGDADAEDLFVFTGSILKSGATYHCFYTGHNPHFASRGRPIEGICHAVSDDLDHWRKLPEDTFHVDPGAYEQDDFRDPFVFWDVETGVWRMLTVCRRRGAGSTGGFTALYCSDDLTHWREDGSLFDPGMFHTHECPDLFQLGNRWYLIYSEYSDRRMTRYVTAPTRFGPWTMPEQDTLDSAAYYAAKSAAHGEKRYLFGWIATRDGNTDSGCWQWGGCLGVHELFAKPDGTLGTRMPETVDRAWHPDGHITVTAGSATGRGMTDIGKLPGDTWRIDAALDIQPGTRRVGLAFAMVFDAQIGYRFELDPQDETIRFTNLGKTRSIDDRDMVRPCAVRNGRVTLQLLYERGVFVLYINGETSLSGRICNPAGADAALYGEYGILDGSVTTYSRVEEEA